MNLAVIEATNLTKTYSAGTGLLDWLFRNSSMKPKTTALNGVNLRIEKGEIITLLGPNGAGKTTLIKILAGLMTPDSGNVNICGFDTVKDLAKTKQCVSLVLGEEKSFYWRLTGRQNLEFFGILYNLSRDRIRQKIKQAAELLDLDLDKRYQECSTGMKFRLALARGFLSDAKLILMDEPTRSLDPNVANRLRELIKTMRNEKGCAFFFATHDVHEAETVADRIVILDQGKIRASGRLSDLRNILGNNEASVEDIFQRVTIEDQYVF